MESASTDEGWDERGNFYRTPVGREWVLRDQWTLGVRQFVEVLVNVFENGDLLQGTERCQYVLSGNPSAYCDRCEVDLTREACSHYAKEAVRRCGRRAWFISRAYGHTLCERHRAE